MRHLEGAAICPPAQEASKTEEGDAGKAACLNPLSWLFTSDQTDHEPPRE